jgi:two-component system, NtrC family, sensor kinase
MTLPDTPSPAAGAPALPAASFGERTSFGERSWTFWRGVSSIQGLAPAMEELLREFESVIGARRASVWIHERRARLLSLLASSDPRYRATAPRVPSGDPVAAPARGMRLERADALDDPEPVVIAPLRGWRRALGALVLEGPWTMEIGAHQRLVLAEELGRKFSVGIENVQLLEELLRQRRLLEDTFNSLIDLVVVTDRRMRVVQMNDAFALRLGRSRVDLLDHHLTELVGRELADWAAAAEADAAADRSHDGARVRTLEHPGLDGIFNVTTTPLINEDGEPVGTVLVARDITRQTALEAEKENLRAKLAQSEKLASLGQFVAGIAHEINNPLQGVLGHLELLLWKRTGITAGAPAMRKELRRIYHEADRAAKIVSNLLAFSGSPRLTRRRLRVDRVLTRALASRRTGLARAGIEVVRDQPEGLPSVVGDQLLLQQAFVNVITNAEHAIAQTGRTGTIAIAAAAHGERVRITVTDSGPGIPEDVLPRIFDPFFTTKEVGQGTGLGLTLTYGVIQEHGGMIHAANAPAGGATITIDLPAAPPVEESGSG